MKIVIAQKRARECRQDHNYQDDVRDSAGKVPYPNAAVEYVLDDKKEIRAMLTIGGIRIGIESQGDPWKKQARLEPSLALFVRLECEVIVCATRTWGGTLDVVRRLEDEAYTVTVRSRTREAGTRSQEARNLGEANWMIEQIEAMFVSAAV